MSKMNQLSQCIEEVAAGDVKVIERMREEIDMHLNGLLLFGDMSLDSQRAVEIFETENQAEIGYGEGHYGYPDDDYEGEPDCED